MTIDEAIKILKEIIEEGWLISDLDKCTAIDACEMAIKALEQTRLIPVNGKVKTAKWKYAYDEDMPYLYCSNCKLKVGLYESTNYCSNCGAKMWGGLNK